MRGPRNSSPRCKASLFSVEILDKEKTLTRGHAHFDVLSEKVSKGHLECRFVLYQVSDQNIKVNRDTQGRSDNNLKIQT